ncbi:MAG: HD domain-containing protein [Candidatus Omnitrophica bacterium]|nr:HD domain-containing protein [Candidatus Omnitrophota bacterium]MCF7894365.1 HD domain-containing protein [Candidatus Omnitrophota bacterium]
MLSKELILKLYEAASMRRWNDQIRPVELTELDKQAHKMIIAYVLAKIEEDKGNKDIDWLEIIEAGIFEYLQRTELTDLKPPLFHRIKENQQKYIRLNQWAYDRLKPVISAAGKKFCLRFKNYLFTKERNLNRRIISAAHFYATKWEFNIIKRANPQGHLINEIEKDIKEKQEKYHDLASMQTLLQSQNLCDFIHICGQLRFQIRWSHIHRVPKTSVLGHMLIVAMFSYLCSVDKCIEQKRLINNYLTGLFHDLPEVLTRDVINPVKRSVEGIGDIIKDYEKDQMQRRIYKILPSNWHQQMKRYTEEEFSDLRIDKETIVRDGELVKACDRLAAFIEVYLSLQNGVSNRDLEKAKEDIFTQYQGKMISGINFENIYKDFKD